MKRVIIITLAFMSVLLIMKNTLRTEQQSVKVSDSMNLNDERQVVEQSFQGSEKGSMQGHLVSSAHK